MSKEGRIFMKKLICLILCCVFVLPVFSSCGSDDVEQKEVNFLNFSQSDITLYEGQQYIVSAVIAPIDAVDKELTWKSSQPEVCSVENGKIQALSKGVSLVTAKTKNGVSSSIMVTVKSLDDLTSIAFSDINITLDYGETYTLSIISTPPTDSQMYTNVWSSSNPQIATVDENGVVTAVGVGSCLIYADVPDVARAVCIVNAHADLEDLVSVSVEGLPDTYDTFDITEAVSSSVELTSYEIERELTTQGVTVTVKIYGVKTYDKEGDDAKSALLVPMSMFMENDQHCIDVDLVARGYAVGDAVEFEYMFNAIIKPQQRQFVIYLGEREILDQ